MWQTVIFKNYIYQGGVATKLQDGAPPGCRRELTFIWAHWLHPPSGQPSPTLRTQLHPQGMPRQCKNLQKMKSFFTIRRSQQNGDGAWVKQPEPKAAVSTNGCTGTHKQPVTATSHSRSSSGTSSPSTRISAKQKQRVTSPDRRLIDPAIEVSGPTGSDNATLRHLNNPIVTFPTSDRPVSDTVLKEMLLSLKASLQADMTAGINNCQREVQAIGGRADHI